MKTKLNQEMSYTDLGFETALDLEQRQPYLSDESNEDLIFLLEQGLII